LKVRSHAQLKDWALGSRYLWLFLDYEGTLADFASTPEVIRTNPEIINIFEQLVSISTIRVTVISGRRLRDLRLLLPIKGLFLAGTYGVELQDETGKTINRLDDGQLQLALEMIKPQWEHIISGRNGFFLEDKGWTLVLHARSAADDEAKQVLAQAHHTVKQRFFARHFRILGGHKFLKVAPSLASKGDTVSYLLNRYPLPEARLLCIGDDDKEEEAFYVIHARGGLAVQVLQPSQASHPTEADFLFESPVDTLCWLESLV
jgi:trehalose 6-phosphate phosphatase